MSDNFIIPATLNAINVPNVDLAITPIQLGSEIVRAFNLQNVRIMNEPAALNISQVTNIDKQLYLSKLGTPVMCDLTFEAGQYKMQDGRTFAFIKNVQVTVLITLQQTKNIVKTEIQGRNGTIKEYIGMGDYGVTINGILTGDNGHYPIEDLQRLKSVLVAPIAINVTSWYLQLFDIYSIVIDSFEMGQGEGAYSMQPFTINAVSDAEVELRLIGKKIYSA